MTFFITPFHYTDCFSVRQIGYGGKTELNDEALGALRSYLAKRNEQLDMRLSEQLEKLYAATVPAAVREYLGEKNGTPVRRSAARPRRAAPAAGHAVGNQPAE